MASRPATILFFRTGAQPLEVRLVECTDSSKNAKDSAVFHPLQAGIEIGLVVPQPFQFSQKLIFSFRSQDSPYNSLGFHFWNFNTNTIWQAKPSQNTFAEFPSANIRCLREFGRAHV